MTGIAVQ
ncbi:hypothetical protein G3Q13_004348 [Escherichia coli]|nr:hypothetical protein [Escherichia coli]EFI3881634.1 hypothetical protein [Escherichia coli]EFI4271451.1 hypothetical protein [Escherichia coli]EFI4363984.1 hypothetical protein [Escherichia coli]EFI8348320.1 hypothetical protein [Escherichia coli]